MKWKQCIMIVCNWQYFVNKNTSTCIADNAMQKYRPMMYERGHVNKNNLNFIQESLLARIPCAVLDTI